MPPTANPQVIVALDVSGRRIGVARCDPTGTLVSPQGVIDRRSSQGGRRRLDRILDEQAADLILVGLPLGRDGRPTVQSERVRSQARQLLAGRPERIEFFDESYTTAEANHRFASDADDAHAAAVMLEHYLMAREGDRG
ncbi:MAG: Holliday junction resolvase RuvX [Chloroflexi bacterium]|nr:Holliday junction resolvase RuvX [Chloroflexota bacterium]MDE2935821.1 Holliday junction resolvase RuvX [Chloroflexota bacterium]MXW27484.1 Holliday junction resolvase RuvX [Chloroflexota bacterium]MXY01064.1 Holliday junction resolvase RuvX [Chloroflexota bacterium]MXY12827.1 Holliday junction resolvase RuvX [Chloroflexota bacterium]